MMGGEHDLPVAWAFSLQTPSMAFHELAMDFHGLPWHYHGTIMSPSALMALSWSYRCRIRSPGHFMDVKRLTRTFMGFDGTATLKALP